MIDIDECKKALECSIGEAEAVLPTEIIESTIHYLEKYKKLKIEMSWIDSPEAMGR